jgi:hypothetical protein
MRALHLGYIAPSREHEALLSEFFFGKKNTKINIFIQDIFPFLKEFKRA